MIARHFMYKQVYLHPIRRVYDIHLKDFLQGWLATGRFSTRLEKHLAISDVEVLSAIRKISFKPKSPQNEFARRIQFREHFRRFYEASPMDREGGKLIPGKILAEAAEQEFGKDAIRHDYIPPKTPAPDFPVRRYDGKVESSLKLSQVLARMPAIEVDSIYCDKSIYEDTIEWRDRNKDLILGLG